MNTDDTIKVLHIDDNKDDLILFKTRISELDSALYLDWASSAEEALELIKKAKYDCILSDHELAVGMNGLELLSALRKGGIEIPFIYLTGQGSEQIAAEAFRLGACDYYSKEYSFAYFHRIANSIRQNVKRYREGLEKKMAEEILKALHKEREYLLSNINDVIWSLEVDDSGKALHKFAYVSPAVEKITGYTRDEILSEPQFWLKWIYSDDLPKVERAIQVVLSGDIYTFEGRIIKKDGSIIWVNTNMVPVKDDSGKIIRLQGVTSDITLRKLAELSCESSEMKYKLIFNSVPQIITIASLEEGRLREVNDTFLTITGYTREEIIGKTVFELGIWVNPDERRLLAREIAIKGSIRGIKTKLKHTNGQMVDASLDALLVTFEDERCVMMIIQLSTESDRAMDDFRRSEERYRFIFSSVSDPLIVLDDKWTVIDINHPAEALLGYDRIDLYGTNIKDLVAGDRQTDLEQQLLKMEGSRNGELVLRFKRKDGRVFEGKFSYSVFHTGDNSYIQGLISGEEVKKESTTARMNAQSEYSDVGNKELADILKGIAESSADIIYIKNSQGKYLFVNDAFAGLVGKPRNEIIGRNGHDFLKMDRAERYRRYTEKALATSRPVVYLDFFSGGPQERVFHTTESPIELGGDGIRLVAGIGRDITDLHRQEERIRIINAELDEFVHKVSHDLRAPLRNISGYIEMAFEKEGEQRRNLLDKAIDQCNKLQSFISRLLELSKAGRTVGNFQDFDSASLVNEVYDLFRSQYQDVELRIDGKLPVIFGDRSSLVQVLQNIMQNALDHLDRTKPKAFVSISAEKKDDEVVFFIRDNGSGIKKSVLDKIFAPSAMIESKGVKTHGFGLSICHRIIEAHKGRIWAESVEGEGSTFYFSLPLSSGQSD